MKSTNPFKNKTFRVKHKMRLFKKLMAAPILEKEEIYKKFKNFFIEDIYPKLLSPVEKYLLRRPFIRTTRSFYIDYGVLGLSLGRSKGFEFSTAEHGIPFKLEKGSTKNGIRIDISDRIDKLCNESDKDSLKDLLVALYEANEKISNFGKDTGIAPTVSYGVPFDLIKTIGQLENFNKEYYEILLELFPEEFKIDKSDNSINNQIIEIRHFLGY